METLRDLIFGKIYSTGINEFVMMIPVRLCRHTICSYLMSNLCGGLKLKNNFFSKAKHRLCLLTILMSSCHFRLGVLIFWPPCTFYYLHFISYSNFLINKFVWKYPERKYDPWCFSEWANKNKHHITKENIICFLIQFGGKNYWKSSSITTSLTHTMSNILRIDTNIC